MHCSPLEKVTLEYQPEIVQTNIRCWYPPLRLAPWLPPIHQCFKEWYLFIIIIVYVSLLFILIIFVIRPTIFIFSLSHKNLFFWILSSFFPLSFPLYHFLFIIFKEYFNKFHVPLGVGLRHGPYSTLPLSCTTESLLSPSSYSGQPSSSSAGR